jgi:TPR repeat protein
MRLRAFIMATLVLVAGVSWTSAARAECELARIARCTVMDPASAERLLLKEVTAQVTPRLLGQLAEFYRTAPATFQDRTKGLWYLRRAVNAEDPPSMIAYADLLFRGREVAADPTTAIGLLERAAWLGAQAPALVALAKYHLSLGNAAAGIEALRRAPATDPEVRSLLEALAVEPGSTIFALVQTPKPALRAPVVRAKAPVEPVPVSVADPPSTLAGRQVTIEGALTAAYAAGFSEEGQLLAAAGLAIAESGLWTAARNWKPEQGYRPASDVITVSGPDEAWSPDGTQQLHSDRGLWQISSLWWSEHPDKVTDNPVEAAKIAFIVSEYGTDFLLWDSFKSGRAQRHYDEPFDGWPPLRPIVRDFLAKMQAPVATVEEP